MGDAMTIRSLFFLCLHDWGFPRRRPEFQGRRDVDVQTCSKCGARRISPVQFGRKAKVDAAAAS